MDKLQLSLKARALQPRVSVCVFIVDNSGGVSVYKRAKDDPAIYLFYCLLLVNQGQACVCASFCVTDYVGL